MINKVFAINGRTFYEVKDENGKLIRGQEIFDYIERLEKALDKAVEDIECYDCSCWDDSTNERCKKCLKERYMKND